MSDINEGEAFVAGRSRETAKALLDEAKAQGLDPSVIRTSSRGGYIVPESVIEAVHGTPADAPEDEESEEEKVEDESQGESEEEVQGTESEEETEDKEETEEKAEETEAKPATRRRRRSTAAATEEEKN